LGSILPTFYVRLFRTKVFGKAFFVLEVCVILFLAQGNWRKCAYKMLVKLTTTICTQSRFHLSKQVYFNVFVLKLGCHIRFQSNVIINFGYSRLKYT
jgi:hypothetical protein